MRSKLLQSTCLLFYVTSSEQMHDRFLSFGKCGGDVLESHRVKKSLNASKIFVETLHPNPILSITRSFQI